MKLQASIFIKAQPGKQISFVSPNRPTFLFYRVSVCSHFIVYRQTNLAVQQVLWVSVLVVVWQVMFVNLVPGGLVD
jgi:hypothetical protein